MSSLLNKAEVRRLIIERAKDLRPSWPCERVSAAAMDQIEASVRTRIERMISQHPSVGKTFLGE